MNKNRYALKEIDLTFLGSLSNETIIDFTMTKGYPGLFDFYNNLKEEEDKKEIVSNKEMDLLFFLREELRKRVLGGIISFDIFMKNIDQDNIYYLNGVCREYIDMHPEKLVEFVKKTAHFSHSLQVIQVIEKNLKLPYYTKGSLSENALSDIRKCFKVIDNRGSSDSIHCMYHYIKNLDIRNLLLVKLDPSLKVNGLAYKRQQIKMEVLTDILYKIRMFNFDDKYILNEELLSIKTTEDFFKSLFKSKLIDIGGKFYFRLDGIINNAYNNIPESHGVLNSYILKKIENKEHISMSVLAHAIKNSPIMEEKIWQYILDENLLILKNKHATFHIIELLLNHCPHLVTKIPKEIIEKEKTFENLVYNNPDLLKHLDYSEANKVLNILKPFTTKALEDKHVSHLGRECSKYLSSFIQYFPFEKLDSVDTDNEYMKKLFIDLLERKSISILKNINSVSIKRKEFLIEKKFLNYSELYELETKNKVTLKDFDYLSKDNETDLMNSFKDFLKKSTLKEVMAQFDNNSKGSIYPFLRNTLPLLMHVLYYFPENKMLEFFREKEPLLKFDTLDELLGSGKASYDTRAFFQNNLEGANIQSLSYGTLIDQCYMVASQQHIMEEMTVKVKSEKIKKF
jgi:hypothetical protein